MRERNSVRVDFTEGKVLLPLLRFAMPVLLALLLQAMYGVVDLIVVGQFASAADVSAVSTGSQIMQTATFIMTGLSMGATILLGQRMGQQDLVAAGDVVGSSICLFSVLSIVMTAVMMIFACWFAGLMQAPAEAFGRTVGYVQICAAGSVFIVAYNVMGGIFRGMGDAVTPLLAVFIACVVNIAGDLLLVAALKMAAAGAAIATVAAQAVSVLLCLCIVRRRGLPFPFHRTNVRFERLVIARIVKLGMPIAWQDGFVSVSFLAILAIANSLGLIVSAGVGVAEKLVLFIMLVPSSYMQSLSAFVAQNIGVGRNDRAVRAMFCGIASSFVLDAVIAGVVFFHGDVLAGLFARECDIIAAAAEYLKAYALDTLLVSFLFCFCGYFNGCGRTRFVMTQGIIGAFAVRVPVSYIMSKIEPVSIFRIGLATPLSTLVQVALCLWYFRVVSREDWTLAAR